MVELNSFDFALRKLAEERAARLELKIRKQPSGNSVEWIDPEIGFQSTAIGKCDDKIEALRFVDAFNLGRAHGEVYGRGRLQHQIAELLNLRQSEG